MVGQVGAGCVQRTSFGLPPVVLDGSKIGSQREKRNEYMGTKDGCKYEV